MLILLKIVKDGDEEVLMTIEDNEEYDKVFAAIEAFIRRLRYLTIKEKLLNGNQSRNI